MIGTKRVRYALAGMLAILLVFSCIAGIRFMSGVQAEATLYSENFEDLAVTASADEIYQNSGIAGANRSIVENQDGLEGKSLKAVYEFFSQAEGGWQKEGLYVNENFTFTAEQSKSYEISFDIAFFGSVEQAVFRIFPPQEVVDSQIIYKPETGTYESRDFKEQILQDVSVVKDGNVWHTELLINGFNDKFKFIFNMLSSNPDKSNTEKDTGLYLDNLIIKQVDQTEDEYKSLLKVDFNGVAVGTSGSDAVFHATGFAGVSTGGGEISIVESGIDASHCLKSVYKFNETDGWQTPSGETYLDSGRTSNTLVDEVYRFSMQIKPFGNIKDFAVVFNYPDVTFETVYLLADGNIRIEKLQENGKLIDAKCQYDADNNIYTLEVRLYGTGGYIFNNFKICSSDPAASNKNADTGFYLDSYLFEQKKRELAPGLNVHEYFYNKAKDNGFSSEITFADVQSVTINDEVVDKELWKLENSILTVDADVFETLQKGEYTLKVTDSSGNADETVIYVDEIELGTVYAIDFEAMPDLGGDQAANDAFFQNSYMDPGRQKIFTVDENGNRYIKFEQDGAVTDVETQMFQFNPNEARLHMLGKGKWHSVTMDWKPQNISLMSVRGLVYDSSTSSSKDLFSMQLDFLSGKRVDTAPQSYNASWRITAKEDGWYELSVTFFYDGDEYPDNAAAYLIYSSAKENENSAWLLDNIDVSSELVPGLVSADVNYDVATGQSAHYIINLYDKFEITSIDVDGKVLTAEKDYTASITPNGYVRIDLAEEFCAQYEPGDSFALEISTSKGNTIVSEFNVIDTSIVMPETTVTYDKAGGQNLEIAIDLAGYAIEKISLNNTDLLGMEYRLDAEHGKLVFMYEYLKNLEIGKYTYTVFSASGASISFTIDLKDTTPVIDGQVIFDKSKGEDLKVSVELFGNAITEIKVGDTVLAADKYSEENGVLIIKAESLAGLAVGEYELVLKTNATVTVKITVTDVVAEFSGTYTAEHGKDLVIMVDLNGKDIVQITVDGLILTEKEWNYSDGKLTILSPIFDEIAAGEKVLSLTTTGGTATLNFILKEEPQASSCNASLHPVYFPVAAITLLAAVLVLHKKRER